MGNKSPEQLNQDNISNKSVLNLSLESSIESNSELLKEDNNSGIIKELMNEIILPIENEFNESSEFSPKEKEEEHNVNLFFENNGENEDILEDIFNKNGLNLNAPKPRPIISNEYVSPLKLCQKCFGINPKINKKLNSVLYEFEKNNIDSKSCNDEDNLDDFFLFDAETERNTLNLEDLHDLLNCRKKMSMFRNTLNERQTNEYENILSIDNIFNENRCSKNKKINFWYKYIKQQQLKDKINLPIHSKRIGSEPLINIFNNENEDNKEQGLFILGVLENASNGKKGRNTVNV